MPLCLFPWISLEIQPFLSISFGSVGSANASSHFCKWLSKFIHTNIVTNARFHELKSKNLVLSVEISPLVTMATDLKENSIQA